MKLFYFTVFSLVLFHSSFAQSDYREALQSYRSFALPEKVFVHTDKDVYAAGETIWGAAYLVDGQTHKPTSLSKIIYVELVNSDQEVIKSLKLLPEEMSTALSMQLPAKAIPGKYQLKAYTNYQLNSDLATLFQKTISIVKGLEAVSSNATLVSQQSGTSQMENEPVLLRFFPEGGDCVEGMPCTMAMIAQDKSGNPIALSGKVLDGDGQFVSPFKTNEYGMFEFSYIPKPDAVYNAIVDGKEIEYALPTPLKKGYTLQVQKQNDKLNVLVQTNVKGGLKNSTVEVHHRGLPFIEETFNISDSKTMIPVKEEDLLPGVYMATLFDGKQKPVAERLFFIAPKQSSSNIDISLSQNQISTGMPIDVEMGSSAPIILMDDSLLISQISLSIVPSFASDKSIGDIRTWLLLNSDLDVPIQDAKEILFDKSPRVSTYLMDLFLKTRGWRRFNWEEVLSDQDKVASYELEQGLSIKGKMLKRGKSEAQVGKVFLSQMEFEIHEESITDSEGNFSFGPFMISDTSTFILQGRYKSGRKKKKLSDVTIEDRPFVDIEIAESYSPELPFTTRTTNASIEDELQEYEDLSQEMFRYDPNYYSLSVSIDEISIKAKRIKEKDLQRKKRSSFYNGNPTQRIITDDDPSLKYANSIWSIVERLPGVVVNGAGIDVDVFIRGQGGDALYVLDGLPIDKETFARLNVREVEFVDFLIGADASIYGSRGGPGVIIAYTRNTLDWEENPNPPTGLKTTDLIGYHMAKEFANIKTSNTSSTSPDVRTTLLWNPKLKLVPNKKVKESFTTSDKEGDYIIVAQGIRKNGEPLFGSLQFEVIQGRN